MSGEGRSRETTEDEARLETTSKGETPRASDEADRRGQRATGGKRAQGQNEQYRDNRKLKNRYRSIHDERGREEWEVYVSCSALRSGGNEVETWGHDAMREDERGDEGKGNSERTTLLYKEKV